MFKSYPSALPRFLVALLLVLFITSCETFNTSPDPKPNNPPPEPQSCSHSNNDLELAEASDIELFLACQIINHPEQQRPEMHYHPTLGEIARARALDMAENGYYGKGREYPSHVDHDGYGPNHYLCEAGYRVDLYCSENPYDNNVESISTSWRYGHADDGTLLDYEKARVVWLDSPPHRRHILGEVEFFANANYYGAGQAVIIKEEEHTDDDGNVRMVSVRYSMWVFIAAYPPQEPSVTMTSGLR